MAIPKPYFQDSAVTIYHGDCADILPYVLKADLLVTDPPYGINWKPRVNHRDSPWNDNVQFNPAPFLGIASKHCFWGANYFARGLPESKDWLAWIKRPINYDFSCDKRSYSTVELAWTDYGCGTRFMVMVWDGGMRAGERENRTFCHPSQKPVELFRWCISLSAKIGMVLDPFMGSGTTLRAAKDLGRKAIGIEIEERYCEIAAKRMAQEVLAY
jgi:site-specific DNA-methyltransferase (adenine-specific)